jgi:hypothetical protein
VGREEKRIMKPLFYIHIATALTAIIGVLFGNKMLCIISCTVMFFTAMHELLNAERKDE